MPRNEIPLVDPELHALHMEYSLWASLRVLEAARSVALEALTSDRGDSFGGILSTLTHIFQADRLWLDRFEKGTEAGKTLGRLGERLTLDDLADQWPRVMGAFAEHARSQMAETLGADLHWINLKGEAKAEKRYKILLHIVNHGTYHRGQVILMLKQAGVSVPSTDLVYYPGM